jgi:site-specific DNA recombinase
MSTRVVGYLRVSTGQQAEGGVSLDAQRARLETFAVAMDLDLIEVVDDESAKSLQRPGLQRALAMLDAGYAEALLVTKLDRLTRSVRDLGELVERYFASQFSLMSVSDSIDTRTAAGRLVLNVLMSGAQWEREACGERTRDALAQVKAQGVKLGGEALGWRRLDDVDADERRLVVEVDEELAVVERVLALRHDEGLSLRQIAATLHDEGYRAKRGGTWAAETVRKVLTRAA